MRKINTSNSIPAQSRVQTTLRASLITMVPPNVPLHSTRPPIPLCPKMTPATLDKTPIMSLIRTMPQHIFTPQTNPMKLTAHRIFPTMLIQLLTARKPNMADQTLLSIEICFDVECLRAGGRDAVGHGVDDVVVLQSREGLRKCICERHVEGGYFESGLAIVRLIVQR